MPEPALLLLLVHAAVTLFLAGLVWTVQFVLYPLFRHAGANRFDRYHREHTRRMGWVAGPAMVAEAATALALLAWRPAGVPVLMLLAGVVLVAALWASTFLVQVPLHRRLEDKFDAATVEQLIQTNWIRTMGWTVRSFLCGFMILLALLP